MRGKDLILARYAKLKRLIHNNSRLPVTPLENGIDNGANEIGHLLTGKSRNCLAKISQSGSERHHLRVCKVARPVGAKVSRCDISDPYLVDYPALAID